MKSLNQEILSIVSSQATHLDTFIAGRAKRFNLKLSGRASETIVSPQADGIIKVEVRARQSIRIRDAGFGRFYHKGVRENLTVKAVRRKPSSKSKKIKKRKKANIINRLMFAMIHNLQRLGLTKMSDVAISSVSEFLH